MDSEKFKEMCESVVFVEEFPPLSSLRQKVAGCYDLFGMCPEGEVVGLDAMGNVNCLKAEIHDNEPWCQENSSRCPLDAKPSSILGVIHLLRDFMVSNFITKEGVLPDKRKLEKPETATEIEFPPDSTMPDAEYADEDLGISGYLSGDQKARRRLDKGDGDD